MLDLYGNMDAAFGNFTSGLIPEESLRREMGILGFYLHSQGGRHIWNIAKELGSISPSFVAYAEKKLPPNRPGSRGAQQSVEPDVGSPG